MNRKEALKTIMETVSPDDAVVSTTGLISREIFEQYHADRNFYIPGSMGLVSSVGLGIAVSCRGKRIIVIDGDSSLLMNLGAIVTIGHASPTNLLHIVIDNGAYGSCSEEKSMSASAHLDRLVKEVGYKFVNSAASQEELKYAILAFRSGPGFILATIELGGRRDFRRPINLTDIKDRFMMFLSTDRR